MRAVLKQTSLWRFARGFKRSLLRPMLREELAPDQCRGLVRLLNPPPALEAGGGFDAVVEVANQTGVPWSSCGSAPVSLRCRWLSHTGEAFDAAPVVARLPRPVYPGEPRRIRVPMPAPDVVGDFLFECDLMQKGWPFAQINQRAKAVRLAVPVIGPRTTDIDYHHVYKTADLAANHWWVVGKYHSREEYERSSQDRLAMLVNLGLTPDSRILDVGCGTGQMAGVLQPYLSDRGAYYGTDIGKEAVDYCSRTFRRKNFHFQQGGMTTLPFDTKDAPFDLALFFSVFTHIYVDETALLLAATAKLLAPTGAVIADVITSPLVERGAGHRGEMIVNRDHFLRLATMANLTGDAFGRWPWNRHAERLMYRLRRSD